MDKTEFKELWDKCIIPSFEKLRNQDNELKIRDGSFESLCRCYNDIKNKTKRTYMQCRNDNTKIRLDRHKIAACLANAILLDRPITKNLGNDYTGSENTFLIANEALAFAVAISTLRAFIKVKIDNNSADIDKNIEAYKNICENDFVFPDTIVGVDYPTSVCWAWHHNILNGYFDVLGTANLFFMIENYSVEKYSK